VIDAISVDEERVRNLYTIISNEALPDTLIDTRVNIIRELERIMCADFKNTEDFHTKVEAYLLRKNANPDRLREYRKSKRWSQADLAIHLAVSQQFVAKMEAGKTPLTDRAIALIGNKSIQSSAPAQFGCQTAIDSKQVAGGKNGISDIEKED